MIHQTSQYTFEIDEKTGALVAFGGKQEYLHAEPGSNLFVLGFRNAVGAPVRIESSWASSFVLTTDAKDDDVIYTLHFADIAHTDWFARGINATVVIRCPRDEARTYWSIDVAFNSIPFLETLQHIEFPCLSLADKFKGSGGEWELFWPYNEGCVIADPHKRNETPFRYSPQSFPSGGWNGLYPGPCQMQFMSVLAPDEGLYIAAHDKDHTVKEIEFEPLEDRIRVIYKVFTGAARGSYHMGYDMVLGLTDGSWHDAAETYRAWSLEEAFADVPKLANNPRVPDWLTDSPLVTTYAVRGVGHHAGPTEPNEYFPFENVLPMLDALEQRIHTKIVNVLMHWEGTAPWSPPFVWPPLGGEEDFADYADALHEQGHTSGAYCSGTAWTQFSSTGDGDYDRREDFVTLGLAEDVCTGPHGEMHAVVCNGDALRWGYDLCASRERVAQLLSEEALKMAAGGVDYIQLFDQNLGAAPYFCYSKTHGHPAGPGTWSVRAMQALMRCILETIEANGQQIVLGCEAGAAEPFIPYLPLNDLRFNMNLPFGRMLPAYNFVYHEYAQNFQGNQVETLAWLDKDRGANNLLLRTAYSFTAGDLMTVVLKDKGDIHWAWCCTWDVEAPPQDSILTLIANLTAWRKGPARPYLVFGRMERPWLVRCETVQLYRHDGSAIDFEAVFTSRWTALDGRQVQIFVNYLEEEREITVMVPEGNRDGLRVYRNADGQTEMLDASVGEIVLRIPPLQMVMVEG